MNENTQHAGSEEIKKLAIFEGEAKIGEIMQGLQAIQLGQRIFQALWHFKWR